ncbi:MAG: LysR family transcriptional regulator [Acidobacteriaceae bacterium]
MYDIVEFRHLRYFIVLAEEGNFTRAARRLRVAQPSLSSQIRDMESCMSVELFIRDRSGVKLTAAGHAFIPHARQLLRTKDEAIQLAATVQAGKGSPLRVAISAFVNYELADAIFETHAMLFPKSPIRPTIDGAAKILDLLRENSIDAALVSLPIDTTGLEVLPIASEKLLVCLRRDDPLASVQAIPREVLEERLKVFFDPEHHPRLYAHLLEILARMGVTVQPAYFASTPADMKWMIKRGLGYALVRESTPIDPELIALPVEGLETTVESAFVYNTSSQPAALRVLALELKKRFYKPRHEPSGKRPTAKQRPAPSSQMKLLG